MINLKILYFFCIISLVTLYNVVAQDTLFIYKEGKEIAKKHINEIDTITYKVINKELTIRIYEKGIPVISLTNIDSITFKNTYVTDIEGNVYPTRTYGEQIWMVENLRTTKFNDGTPLLLKLGLDNEESYPSIRWYDDDKIKYSKNKYGALYKGVDSTKYNLKNICPVGWHIPKKNDFTNLLKSIDNNIPFAKDIASITGWKHTPYPTEGSVTVDSIYNNISKFNILPTGTYLKKRGESGKYTGIGEHSYLLSVNGYALYINNYLNGINYGQFNTTYYSIRCVKYK